MLVYSTLYALMNCPRQMVFSWKVSVGHTENDLERGFAKDPVYITGPYLESSVLTWLAHLFCNLYKYTLLTGGFYNSDPSHHCVVDEAFTVHLCFGLVTA